MDMLFGQMLERLNQLADDMHEVRIYLMDGHSRFDRHEARIVAVEQKLERRSEVPRWERHLKNWATYLWPGLVLWATGSIDAAVKILQALK